MGAQAVLVRGTPGSPFVWCLLQAMARSSKLATSCVCLAVACLALKCSRAFLPTPGEPAPAGNLQRQAALAAATLAAASLPGAAGAFYYDGKEYYDITFGISPLAWGVAAFAIIVYGAVLKNAALKYNKPYGTTTLRDPKPPKPGSDFKGMEIENNVGSYKV